MDFHFWSWKINVEKEGAPLVSNPVVNFHTNFLSTGSANRAVIKTASGTV